MKKETYTISHFEFSLPSCECEVDKIHPSKGIVKHIFHLYPSDDVIRFMYVSGQGLVGKKSNTSRSCAVLPDMLSIKNGDIKGLQQFLEKYGFFLRLLSNESVSVDAEHLFGLINRISATVSLMSALTTTNYNQILSLTMYLLLSPEIHIKLPDESNPFTSYVSELGYYFSNINEIPECKLHPEPSSGHVGEGYHIVDSIYPPTSWLSLGDYADATGHGEMNFPTVKDKIIYLYRNAISVSSECRLAIDLFYHIWKNVGEIQTWNHKGELIFKNVNSSASTQSKMRLDENLRVGLNKLAKHTLKTELEFNLSSVFPSYDTDTMTPSWRIDDLLAGLYLSVFYIQPDIELYRICENPKCRRPFLVQTTNERKIYCSQQCSGAMATRMHRLRQRDSQVSDV